MARTVGVQRVICALLKHIERHIVCTLADKKVMEGKEKVGEYNNLLNKVLEHLGLIAHVIVTDDITAPKLFAFVLPQRK